MVQFGCKETECLLTWYICSVHSYLQKVLHIYIPVKGGISVGKTICKRSDKRTESTYITLLFNQPFQQGTAFLFTDMTTQEIVKNWILYEQSYVINELLRVNDSLWTV